MRDIAEARMGGKASGLVLALTSALAFGGAGPFAKPLIDAGVTPLHVTWLRIAGVAFLLLPVAWHYRRTWKSRPGLLLAYGIFPMAGVQAFYFAAISRIPVGIALLIEFLAPVLVLLWVALLRGRAVGRSATIGVILSVAGLVALLEVWSGIRFDTLGIVFALAAAGCQAGYFLLSDAASDDVEPLALIGIGACVAFLVMTALAQPWLLPWHLLAGEVMIAGIATSGLVSVAWLGLVSTAIAYVSGVAAVRRLSPSVAGAVAYLEVVVAMLLAWLMLGETLSAMQALGAIVVVAGAYVAQRSRVRMPEPAVALSASASPGD